MSTVIRFNDPTGTDVGLVGGKGVNLGELANAGFSVPRGFTVSTEAYATVMAASGANDKVFALLEGLDYQDLDKVDRTAAEIRGVIVDIEVPGALAKEIADAYAELGDDAYVAVRSSGTAEDTVDSSFAGMHDTYLDIRGVDQVLDAVRRCWASMWTARAVSYRQERGFDHRTARLAVVVQTMVQADVSGVMFTANPLNNRTDELVINAAYGLGEAIVSGIINPDEFTVDLATVKVKQANLGDKKLKIVRAPDQASGTVELEVAGEDAKRLSLSDAQVGELAALGRKVMAHYGGLPQDIEWAYVDGEFHLLQARPITAGKFTWPEGFDDWQNGPEEEDTLWTFKYAEQYWTGGITPLFYSVRARETQVGYDNMNTRAGFQDLLGQRLYKYKFGTVYWNVDLDEKRLRYVLPKFARPAGANVVPTDMQQAFFSEPLDVVRWLKAMISFSVSPVYSLSRWKKVIREDYLFNEAAVAKANGLPEEELKLLSDDELNKYQRSLQQYAIDFMDPLWFGAYTAMSMFFALQGALVAKFYTGTNALLGQELISGLPTTLQNVENRAFFELTNTIRNSKTLSETFAKNEGAAFFAALESSDEGREFLEQYNEFIVEHGHRGHPDRDLIFKRRADDPAVDYEAFKVQLASPAATPPEELETRVRDKRLAAEAEVVENLGQGSMGMLKQQLFSLLQGQIIDFLVLRDDWRHFIDRISYAKRKAFLEVARRCVERGYLNEQDDAFFLGETELFEVLRGGGQRPLVEAKIAARREDFDVFESRNFTPPTFMRGETPVDDALPSAAPGSGALVGVGTSAGQVEGRVRVLRSMSDIGSLEKGDVLICNATDPGWSPVFGVISGLIIETGGMLAHGACLSREHGIPAVQIVGATQIIPDGVHVRINGTTGVVEVLDMAQIGATS
ncbi:PEP-utilizing enzyme [Gordonia sp. GONU]|uniref:PEP/pyruvate-binding domain-containing protein n=1 Tax=Gordonia sp. GONU TaxID=2972949 RepID=UPI0021AD0903|nr:PEP/pyruvate-binding domain-containing protein [Gordonia sp. GONU]MCR8899856.1 PEP-utilizing enzyme [Gordonia sp. GONU]